MAIKTIQVLGLALAVAAGLATGANAQVVYTWVPRIQHRVSGSGMLDVNSLGGETSLTFVGVANATSSNSLNALPPAFGGSAIGLESVQLSNGNSVLACVSIRSGLDTPQRDPNANTAQSRQQANAQDSYFTQGNWVPTAVPEPTTVIAGVLMLLPFGATILRILRRNNPA